MGRPPGTSGPPPAPFDMARLARRASAQAGGADPGLLDGYLDLLAAVATEGRRLDRHELDDRRAVGVACAERGVPLTTVVDLYLGATWLAWRHLPRPAEITTDDLAGTILRAVNDTVAALADGYEHAQRLAIRHQEAMRREFIDDLLTGTGDLGLLPDRAARFGLRLAGSHAVAVARAPVAFTDGDVHTRRAEAALLERFGAQAALVVTKDGQLVCVAPGNRLDVPHEFAHRLTATTDGHGDACQVGVGRPYPGPAGVARSYGEAREVLELAGRLGLDTPVLHTADLLVFQVLFRDRAAITDLVATVLSPLQQVRGGAQPLLDTLAVYFAAGNAVAAARRLHVGVRTVTYRLQRVRELTGYHAADPTQRFTLETAVLGARLLGWPAAPLDR